MRLIHLDPADRRRITQFLELPFQLYRDTPQWVPPLRMEARQVFDRKRYPFYRHSDAAFFLALDQAARPVGRIAAIDNRNYNIFNQERTAFFYLFECIDDRETALALFEAAFEWAGARGLDKMIGPKGFTALDGMGLLVKGFEHRPAFGIPYNLPYYSTLIEAAGFTGVGDVVSGYLNPRMPFPDKVHQVAALVQKRRGLRVTRFKSRRELRALIPQLQAMYNDSLSGTTGNTPLTDAEVQTLANQLEWFADPKLIKIVLKDDQPVGFMLAYPDISAALQRTRGRLFPFGWIDLLLELKRTKWVNVNGAGIIEKYRGLGGTALLFSEMHHSVIAGGFDHADIVQVGVDNEKMQRELRDLGIDFYKLHRLYQRAMVATRSPTHRSPG
ncbi:MAG TPA: hypothetical protein VJG32_01010 [Anaerolineae bacterium]|nr:hypothetical protein [Anaerolineae bacterium]